MKSKDIRWHYRTMRHINSNFPEDEPFETAHQFNYDHNGTGEAYESFSFEDAISLCKEDAQRILQAYDSPPAIEVDEANYKEDEYGSPDYTEYEWLDKRVTRKQ